MVKLFSSVGMFESTLKGEKSSSGSGLKVICCLVSLSALDFKHPKITTHQGINQHCAYPMANLFPTFIKFFILLVLGILVNRRAVVGVNFLHEEPATQLELTERTHQLSSAPRQYRTSNGEESACIPISLPSTSKDTSKSGGIGDSASHSNHQPGEVELESIVIDDRPVERGHGGATSSWNSVSEIDSQDTLNGKVLSSNSPPHSLAIPIFEDTQQIRARIDPGDTSMTRAMIRQVIRL
ncbi:hypothetical protein PTTG_28513 [Puccinia triticina 1-1 BBBD Race 1]|uniref:Uncharacterized protein n=1 Tax=Puccinia triticina (isolate 1-1 / race 1 (BBBD)) TaxID=630390 RepID=A0A180GAY9_PUCT1|nr:hypothetical protein PTTG_28513 [Puccinia triticina 1-1 BBBD Race 1]